MRKLAFPRWSCVLAAAALAAQAQSAEAVNGPPHIEANISLASDYSFRGWSQTRRDPALQGGFDVSFGASGLYIGTWASNVNFGAGADGDVASLELDLYAGWAGEVADGVEVDIGVIHFGYPGDDALDYQELAASATFGGATLGVHYSPEYLGERDVSFFYPYADYTHALTADLRLTAHLGLNLADSPGGDFFGADDDYIDYALSASFPAFGAELSIGLYGTDNGDSCGADCKLRPIVSISRAIGR